MTDPLPQPSTEEVANHLRTSHGLDLGEIPGQYIGQAKLDHHNMHHKPCDHVHETSDKTVIWGTWTSKLLEWQTDAAVGDNGEMPTIEVEYDGNWWDITARSFYDGYADARAKTIEEAAREVIERLTTHPERQLDAEIKSAAIAFARVAKCSHDEAERIIREKRG